jgi:hypothetical protein
MRLLKKSLVKLKHRFVVEITLNIECPTLSLQLEKQAFNFQKREQDLLHQLMQPLPQRTMCLFNQLKADHEALLHSHLQSVHQVAGVDSNENSQNTESHSAEPLRDSDATPVYIVQSIKTDDATGKNVELVVESVEEKSEESAPESSVAKRKASSTTTHVKKLRFDQ